MPSRNKTPPWAMLLVAGCTLLLATGQVMMKLGAERGISSIPLIATNPFLWVGLTVYTLAALLLTFALKYGDLSALYPIIALGFVWVTLASVLLLHEQLAGMQLIGIIVIIAGVSIVGRGA